MLAFSELHSHLVVVNGQVSTEQREAGKGLFITVPGRRKRKDMTWDGHTLFLTEFHWVLQRKPLRAVYEVPSLKHNADNKVAKFGYTLDFLNAESHSINSE